MARYFNVTIAINVPELAATARYDGIRGQDADHAVALAVRAAEAEFGTSGWLLERCEEDELNEIQESIDLMAAAMLEANARWERGETASPDARDLVYEAGRAVGIGTLHGDISEALVDDFYAYQCEGPEGMGADAYDLAYWLALRLF